MLSFMERSKRIPHNVHTFLQYAYLEHISKIRMRVYNHCTKMFENAYNSKMYILLFTVFWLFCASRSLVCMNVWAPNVNVESFEHPTVQKSCAFFQQFDAFECSLIVTIGNSIINVVMCVFIGLLCTNTACTSNNIYVREMQFHIGMCATSDHLISKLYHLWMWQIVSIARIPWVNERFEYCKKNYSTNLTLVHLCILCKQQQFFRIEESL